MRSVFRALPNLQRVNIKVTANQLRHEAAVCQEIAVGLNEVRNLRELTIDSRHTDCDFAKASWRFKGDWPLLEKLRLSGVTSMDHLLSFLRTTAKSLRTLELVEVQFSSEEGNVAAEKPRWDDCLEKVRQTLQLQRARVRSLYYKDGKHLTVFFSETTGSTSEINRTVESFLTRSVEILPRQETWDGTNIRNALEDLSDDESSQSNDSPSASAMEPDSDSEPGSDSETESESEEW